MFIQLNNSYQKISESGGLDMTENAVNNIGLKLDEGKHLDKRFISGKTLNEKHEAITSAGFLLRKTAFILAKWDAMTIWVFISSGDLSRTVSQNGDNNRSELVRHASGMVHISLQRTSVDTYGYLGKTNGISTPQDRRSRDVLESALVLALYLTGDIPQEPL